MGDYKLRSGFENALLFDSVPPQYYDPDYYPKLPPGRPVVIRLPLAGIPKGGKYYRWNEILPNGHVYRAKHLAQPGSVRNVAAIPAGTSTVHVDGKGNVAPSAMGLHYPVAGGALCDWPAGDYRVLGWVAGCVVVLFLYLPGALANRYRYNRKKNFRMDGRRLLSPCLTHGRLLPCAVVYLRVCARVRVPSSIDHRGVPPRTPQWLCEKTATAPSAVQGRIRKASENITGETPGGPSKVNHAEVPPRAASRASPCATASRHASSAAALER